MTAQAEERQQGRGGSRAVYVYGIMPGDVEVEAGTAGVGDPPGEVRVVKHAGLAALVSDVNLDRPLGRAEDLFAHEQLLDASAAEVPVLPLRFGAVVTDDKAVAEELLGPHHDEFAEALRQLDGQTEFVVQGRYVEHAILREVLAEDPDAAQLNEEIKGTDENATRQQRMELGEIIGNAIEAKRQADTEALGDALSGQVTASMVRPPSHELDAAYVAFLVPADKADALRQAVSRLAEEWQGRIELRLLGPLAAYDFVGAEAPAPDAEAGAGAN
ncbi:MAG TPA: GvpL/GvpF family gas vesicle protein [Trebonia sp.]|nr:GvpL/GvpF family gas vesicle protein [Trebonia sp.]